MERLRRSWGEVEEKLRRVVVKGVERDWRRNVDKVKECHV